MAEVITEAMDPAQSTLSPNFANYVYRMLARGEQAAGLPFQPYTGQRYAGIQPLLQETFQRYKDLTVPSQLGEATGIARLAAERAGGLGTESFTAPGTADKFMSPYMQAVVNAQQREATRQADIARTGRQARFAQAGAYGGSRQAVEEAEAERNLQQRLGDIQATGLQQAYQSAQDQFNREQAARMQGVGQQVSAGQLMSGIGSQAGQLGLSGLTGMLGAGQQQQTLAQQPFDFGYQQFQQSLQYPFQQATFMQSLLGGLPLQAARYVPEIAGGSTLGSGLQGGLLGLGIYNAFTNPPK